MYRHHTEFSQHHPILESPVLSKHPYFSNTGYAIANLEFNENIQMSFSSSSLTITIYFPSRSWSFGAETTHEQKIMRSQVILCNILAIREGSTLTCWPSGKTLRPREGHHPFQIFHSHNTRVKTSSEDSDFGWVYTFGCHGNLNFFLSDFQDFFSSCMLLQWW